MDNLETDSLKYIENFFMKSQTYPEHFFSKWFILVEGSGSKEILKNTDIPKKRGHLVSLVTYRSSYELPGR